MVVRRLVVQEPQGHYSREAPFDGQVLVGEPEMSSEHVEVSVLLAGVSLEPGVHAVLQVAELFELGGDRAARDAEKGGRSVPDAEGGQRGLDRKERTGEGVAREIRRLRRVERGKRRRGEPPVWAGPRVRPPVGTETPGRRRVRGET